METYRKLIAMAAAGLAAVSLNSCLGDLDTIPLNPYDISSETAYGKDEAGYVQGLTKLYFQFISNDTKDLQVSDGGASELIRAFWSVQETSTDEAKCAWENDAWVRALNTNTWSEAQNDATYAVYVRTLQGISYANEYLRQTTSDKLDSRGVDAGLKARAEGYRAEARFLRAYFYWMLMDTFGNVPFITEESDFGVGVNPQQKSRAEVFSFCVSELEELAADGSAMPAARSNYPRADKGAVKGLLARLYVNAEVYSGTPMWEEAKKTCEDIFAMGYDLCGNYADLFRGDNGENPEARKEIIFAAAYDAEQSQSYGGTSYLTLAAVAATDVTEGEGDSQVFHAPNGVNNGWAGIRTTYEFVSEYFDVANPDYTTGTYDCADKRGQMFYIKGRTETMQDALYVFANGWSCLKFNNIPSGMTAAEFNETARTKAYSDIDYPLIRLGEIYLIYAEACMHLDMVSEALPYMEKLAERAGVEAEDFIDQNFLIAERARELMWEGHRRTDLIRYGVFNTSEYTWPYKGNSYQGTGFPEYMNIFAIPLTDLAANVDLKQNPGYADVL